MLVCVLHTLMMHAIELIFMNQFLQIGLLKHQFPKAQVDGKW